MPLKADPKGGGTNADGTRSQEYCSYCYVGGQFINANMTIEEMRALVIEKLRERGFPKFVARFFASGLDRLKRWR
jgi:Putative zinc ribbon domain